MGRKILLSVGTGGIILCLASAGLLFNSFESKRVDVLEQVRTGISADGRSLAVKVEASLAPGAGDAPSQLGVTYKYEKETKPQNRLRLLQRVGGKRPHAQDRTSERKEVGDRERQEGRGNPRQGRREAGDPPRDLRSHRLEGHRQVGHYPPVRFHRFLRPRARASASGWR